MSAYLANRVQVCVPGCVYPDGLYKGCVWSWCVLYSPALLSSQLEFCVLATVHWCWFWKCDSFLNSTLLSVSLQDWICVAKICYFVKKIWDIELHYSSAPLSLRLGQMTSLSSMCHCRYLEVIGRYLLCDIQLVACDNIVAISKCQPICVYSMYMCIYNLILTSHSSSWRYL